MKKKKMAAFEALPTITGFLVVAYLVGTRKTIENRFLERKDLPKEMKR